MKAIIKVNNATAFQKSPPAALIPIDPPADEEEAVADDEAVSVGWLTRYMKPTSDTATKGPASNPVSAGGLERVDVVGVRGRVCVSDMPCPVNVVPYMLRVKVGAMPPVTLAYL